MSESVRVVGAVLSVECEQTSVPKPVSIAVLDNDNQIATISLEELRRVVAELDRLEVAHNAYLRNHLVRVSAMIGEGETELSPELLSELRYEPDTGNFIRMKGKHRGQIAGGGRSCGYKCVRLGRGRYQAHRLAWYYMTGEWPGVGVQIDHINTNRNDNRWVNLRKATHGQNKSNGEVYCNNKIGLKGVGATSTGRFRARIRKDGIEYQIGTYDTPEEAHKAYAEAAAKMHGEFARA